MLLSAAFVTNAEIYTVDTLMDLPDNDLNDGVCDTGLSGNTPTCSLRAAVMESNASQGVEDTILLPNDLGAFKLTRVDEDDDAFKGDLDILDDVSIRNGTLSGAIIDGDFKDRIFHVHADSSLTLEGIHLINGLADTLSTFEGGAIFVEGGSLFTNRVTLNNNVANRGGAISSEEGDVFLENTYIQHNATSDSGLAATPRGSAIYSEDSNVIIKKSTLAHNINPSANPQSVEIYNTASSIYFTGDQSELFLNNSTVSHNYTGVSVTDGELLEISQTTIAHNIDFGVRAITAEEVLVDRSLLANNGFSCLFGVISIGPNFEYSGSTDSVCNMIGNTNTHNMPNPLHSALNHWGGYVPTLMLYPDAEAIDAVVNCHDIYDEDQRGGDRPLNGDDDMFVFCDMGAIEYNKSTDNDIIFRDGLD